MTLPIPSNQPAEESPLTIWIDADSSPREVKEIVFRASKRLDLSVRLVANQTIYAPPSSGRIQSITVPNGANVADKYIVDHVSRGDLVITADIPLAAQLVDKQVWVLDPRGLLLDDSNVRSRLAARDIMDAARGAGMEISGPSPYNNQNKTAFASALDRILTKATRKKP